jgi:hypothetical protein
MTCRQMCGKIQNVIIISSPDKMYLHFVFADSVYVIRIKLWNFYDDEKSVGPV